MDNDDVDKDEHTSWFVFLPDVVLLKVASYLDPPDTYAFNNAYDLIANTTTRQFSIPSILWGDDVSIHNNPQTTTQQLGELLLFQSQVAALFSILQNEPSFLTMHQIKRFIRGQQYIKTIGQSLIISGSTMVKVFTGLPFQNSDIDLYADASAMPPARKLLRELGFICHNVNVTYHGSAFDGSSEMIHHIETYVRGTTKHGRIPRTTAMDIKLRWRREHLANLQGIPVRDALSMANNRRGYAVEQLSGFLKFPMDFPFTKNANSFQNKVFDLIVVSRHFSPTTVIANFDLGICKCSFDGLQFICPDEDATYSRPPQTSWDLRWKHLVEEYVTSYLPQVNDISRRTSPHDPITLDTLDLNIKSYTTINISKLIWLMSSLSQAFLNTRRCVLPCSQHGFNCDCGVSLSNGFLVKLHNRIVKQFKRCIKYVVRGVTVPMNDNLIEAFIGDETPPLVARTPHSHSQRKRYKISHYK